MARRARETKPDIIHICNINHLSLPFWRRELEKTGIPVVASAHDVRREKAILSRTWEERQLKRFYQFADHLFVHSRNQKSELLQFAGGESNKVTVVPHGPYEFAHSNSSRKSIRSRLGIPETVTLGLAFGLIRDEKHLDRLIEAFAQLPRNQHLLVAGSSVSGHRPASFYRSLIAKQNLTSRIHFQEGYVDDEQVSELFSISDWVALTYAQHFSSQSGVLNCAVHYEKPIVATPAPAFKESLNQFRIGVLCKDDSVQAIATGIKRLVDSCQPEFEFKLYQESNSWRANAELTVGVYRQLADYRN